MENKELSLREIQIASMEILKDVDSFCRENTIKYFVFFGTLIGAVRHKGFIPWDDDVDIVMPRNDYDRFIQAYGARGKYRLINHLNERKCPFMITRVSDDKYSLQSNYGPEYKIGTFIDVYPLDGVGNTIESAQNASYQSRKYSSGLGKSLERNVIRSVKETHNGFKKWLLLFTYILPKIKGSNYYRNRLLDLRKIYPEYDQSQYVGSVTWAMLATEYFKREWFDETTDLQFEDFTVMAPKEYDKVLTQNFGNYMELPPKKDRIAHHYYKIFER